MKELFVNRVGKKLIEDKGFFITITPFISFLISQYTFIKDSWGALYVINFIDADEIDFSNNLKDVFLKELFFFKEKTNSNAIIYYKIFITQNGISEEAIANILYSHSHSLIEKNTFIPVVIDSVKGKVLTNVENELDKSGIIKTITEELELKETDTTLYDLNSIQQKVLQGNGFQEINDNDKNVKPNITYILIAINIAVLILMELSGGSQNPDVLKSFGIKINSLIISGQYWRLLTSAFIHIGFAHAAFNMYGLYNLGSLVERIYGHKKFLTIYMSAALWGSISSFVFSSVPSAGASGAIFGLFGALIVLGQKKPKLFTTSFGINIIIVLAFNLIYGFSNTGIDNFAHIGGLIGGYLSANTLGLKYDKKYGIKSIVGLILIVLLMFIGLLWGIVKW